MTPMPPGPAGAETSTLPDTRLPVSLLVAFSILGPVTIHLILPALPHLQTQFGADYATTQLLVSFFVVAFGAGQILVGPMADLFGKRRVLVAGMALFSVASALCALAPGITVLIGLRILQGIGACAGTVLARAMILDHYRPPASTRILGYLAIGISIGPIIAPTAGGLLFEIAGWRMSFWVLAALGLANTALALWLLPAGPGGAAASQGLGRLAHDVGLLLRDRGFILNWLTVCFNSGTVFTFIACAALIGDMYLGLTPTLFGMWFGLGAVGYIIGNFVSGRLAGRFRASVILAAGVFGVALATGLIVLGLALDIRSPLMLFGLFSTIMAASGFVMPNAYAGSIAAVPAAAGSASGFVGFAQYVVGAIFATVAGHLIESRQEPVWLGIVMAVASVAGIAVALAMLRPVGAEMARR